MSPITPSGPPPGFVVGLAAEARLLAGSLRDGTAGIAPRVACAAADSGRARRGAERLLAGGAVALVSFGIAGGLDPALLPGDLVLAERVAAPGCAPIRTDPDWRARWAAAARAAGLRTVGGDLIESPRVVAGLADKRLLHLTSGAVATDMESYAVAAVAAEAGVPFAAVRAIADPAGRPLPRAAIGIIGPDGSPRVGRLILRLCVRPWECPELFRLRRDTDAALASLGRLAGGLGPAGLS